MVKTPKTRHSKTHREPVTIELEPGAVSRVEDVAKAKAEAVAEAESVSATMGDEAVAEPAASEPKAPADTDFASYSYDFDNGQQPKAEAPARAAASDAGSSYASSSAASTSTPVRQSTSGILPGLAGGLIALLVAGGLQYAGVLGTPGNAGSNGDEQLQAEIASLKSQVADIGASSGGGELKGQVDGISAAVQEVKSEIEALKTASGQAGSGEALAGLDGRIKQIEAAVATLGQNGAASTEIAALNERLAGLDAAVKSAGEAATADDGKIATLEQSVSTLASKVEAQVSQPKIALAIAASALKAAVDRGGAFGAELETFAAISPDAPELATLRAHAEKGVATRADIVAETDAAANAMITAAKPVNPDAGVFERLVSSAEQLVKVRPIGAVEGAGAPETVARMELAVSQGDFGKAIAEYETLPDAAKAAGADFAAKLKARLEVETLVDQLVANAMKA